MEGSQQPQLGDSHFKKPIVFSFASWDVAIFLAALYELHTHFVLSELDQKPRRGNKTHVSERWSGRNTQEVFLKAFLLFTALTTKRHQSLLEKRRL